jgi:hypothetical protein
MTNQNYRRCLAMLSTVIALSMPCLALAENAVSHIEYDAHWAEAAQALAEFTNVDLAQKNKSPVELYAIYRQQNERYANALAWLAQRLPPADAMQAHWQLLPRHEQVLAAMSIICESDKRNDEPRRLAGWTSFRTAVNLLRHTAETLSGARK